MLKHHTPGWIYAGGLLLAAVAGCVNAVAVGSVFHPVTHMSGTVFSVSYELAHGNRDVALRAAAVVVSFFLGATLSGLLIRQSTLQAGQRYGVALLLESGLLVGSWLGVRSGVVLGEVLAAMACGLQNALATSYSGAVVRTTHMTGIITDLGIAAGHWLARHPVEWFRVRLHLVILLGFASGGAVGAFGFTVFGVDTLLFPAGTVLVAGLVYTIRRRLQRQRHAASVGVTSE
jgi:uncharacterized membrane protein YoaK (UPF0700 family)